MALIHCPECNKEVSDTAKMCPHCGYDIAGYIQQIEQQKKKEQEEQERQEREQKLADYTKARIENRNRRIREEAKPLTISYFKREIICSIIAGLLFLLIPLGLYETDIGLILSSLLLGCAVLFFGVMPTFGPKKEVYDLSHSNLDKYIEYLIQKADKAEHDSDEAIRKARLEASLTHTVRCPNCGSMNVEKVSNAERLTSIAMMGPASKKIGKQYKCKNCDYLW